MRRVSQKRMPAVCVCGVGWYGGGRVGWAIGGGGEKRMPAVCGVGWYGGGRVGGWAIGGRVHVAALASMEEEGLVGDSWAG